MTVKHYTGVQGVVKIDGSPIAVSEFGFTVDRGTASHARSGKWSDLNAPGKLKVTGTIKRIMVDSNYLKAALNAAASTGEAYSLVAAYVIDCTSAPVEKDDETAGAHPTLPSQLRVSLSLTGSAGIATAGAVTLIGTDANDQPISETILLPVTTDTAAWDTSAIFKKFETAIFTDVICDTTSTLAVDSIAATSSFTLAKPKFFAIIGKVVDGSDNIIVTMTNCWFTKGGLSFTDADKMVEEDLPFMVEDPDVDITISGT